MNQRKNASVDKQQGVMVAYPGLSRKIAQTYPAGAVPLEDRETAYVIQAENQRRIGLKLLENVGADRLSVVNEAGSYNEGVLGSNDLHLTNSQPLVYLEQELVAQAMKNAGLGNYLLAGGMLQDVELLIPDKRPSEIVLDKIRNKLEETQDKLSQS